MENPKVKWSDKALDPYLMPHPTNLIINYLPKDTTDQEVIDMFSTFGKIRSVKIIRDTSGICAGYGFVNYENYNCAKTAQVILNGRELRNKRIKVAFALPRGTDIRKCNLFVRFLPVSVNEEQLENLFEGYGKIWAVKLLRDKLYKSANPPFNVAYVRFMQPLDAEKARIALDGYRFPGATEPISVKTAKKSMPEKPKEDGAEAMEDTRSYPPPSSKNQVKDNKFACTKNLGKKCFCEMKWSPTPAPEFSDRPEGFIFPDLD